MKKSTLGLLGAGALAIGTLVWTGGPTIDKAIDVLNSLSQKIFIYASNEDILKDKITELEEIINNSGGNPELNAELERLNAELQKANADAERLQAVLDSNKIQEALSKEPYVIKERG